MDSRQHVAQGVVQALRRIAADHRDQGGERSRLGPQPQFAQPQRVESLLLGAAERIPHEILDRDQHRGDQLRILACRILGRDMGDQQPGVAVDQENVLDLIDERVLQHDFGEGQSGPPSFQRHLSPRQVRLYFSDSLSDWKVSSMVSPIDLRIAGTING